MAPAVRAPAYVRVALLFATGVGLLALALLAGAIGPWTAPPRTPTQDVTPSAPDYTPPVVTETPAGPSGPPADAGPWLRVVLFVLIGVAVAAVVIVIIRRWRQRLEWTSKRSEPTAQPMPSTLPAIPAIPVEDRTFNAREAAEYVIACWEELERAGASIGRPRRPEQTPTEFLESATEGRRIDAGAALLKLYQHARFDHSALAPDTLTTARASLKALLEQLRTPSAVGPGE